MLNFSRSGLLLPDSAIPSTLNELQSAFVTNIPTSERVRHFNAYVNYSNSLKKICGNKNLVQWINGSFVTKAPKPKDIDIVTFIDVLIISALGSSLDRFKYPESERIFQVDAYIVPVYPIAGKQYNLYQHDKAYWTDKFGKTRRNRSGKKLSKGFLEIIY